LVLLMIPVVVRSTEEMLKLVPNELREASYALGVPKWKTITRIVLPTAFSGIVTGVMLGLARVMGETAPLLILGPYTKSINTNLFDGYMPTLPTMINQDRTEAAWTPAMSTASGRRAHPDPHRPPAQPLGRWRRFSALPADRPPLKGDDPHHGQAHRRRATSTSTTALQGRRGRLDDASSPAPVTAFIGPSGCGKSTVLRTLNRMHEVIPGAYVEGEHHSSTARDLYARTSTRWPCAARRHGLPAAQPVPHDVDLRQRLAGLKLNGVRTSREARRGRRAVAARAPTCGTRSRTGSTSRAPASPAASSSACASPARSPSSRRCC
jgi:hypothetical protein